MPRAPALPRALGCGRGRGEGGSGLPQRGEERRCVSSAVRRGGTGGAGAGLPGAGRCARGRWAAGGRGERGAVCQEENGVKRGKTQTFTRRHRGMRSALLEESIVLEGGDLRGKGHLEPREHLFFFLLFLHAVRGAGRYGALLRHPSSPLALKQRYCGQCSAACLFVPLAVPLAGLRTCSPGAAIVRCC